MKPHKENYDGDAVCTVPYEIPLMSTPLLCFEFIGSGEAGSKGVRSPATCPSLRSRSTILHVKMRTKVDTQNNETLADPRMIAAVVMRLARFLLWLSSYRSVSSTISSEMISCFIWSWHQHVVGNSCWERKKFWPRWCPLKWSSAFTMLR
jgi:hypothetical protein